MKVLSKSIRISVLQHASRNKFIISVLHVNTPILYIYLTKNLKDNEKSLKSQISFLSYAISYQTQTYMFGN